MPPAFVQLPSAEKPKKKFVASVAASTLATRTALFPQDFGVTMQIQFSRPVPQEWSHIWMGSAGRRYDRLFVGKSGKLFPVTP